MPPRSPWLRDALLVVALALAGCVPHHRPPPVVHLSPEICLADLDRLHVQYVRAEAPEGPCPVYDAVRVSADGVPWNPPGLVTCDLALRFNRFVTEVVQPAAQRYLHASVTELRQFGTYSCRGQPNGEWSEHAKGDAIDVAGFTLDNGDVVTVERDWRGDGPKSEFLHAVARGACGLFNIVLTPHTNYDHRNHVHFDIGPWKDCSV
ncbi:MAG: extensin family protein [Alphaproteobacteria bacterium]|nr:extensin family protein [Alphaproteobacteria bacterium]